MRFKPWMLASQSKASHGPWSTPPPPVLAALTSADQSPMVLGYLINGSWPGVSGTKPAFVAPEQEQEQEQQLQTKPQPELSAELAMADKASSLSLTIRLVQPIEEGTTPTQLQPKKSTWRRFLQAIQRKAA